MNHFFKFWRLIPFLVMLYFIPQTLKKDRIVTVTMIFVAVLVSWGIVDVKHDFKSHANLILFFMVGYQTFVLFRREQNLLKDKETQLLEQEKDVAIGRTAAVLAHDVRRPLEQMKLILNRLSLGDTSEEFIKAAAKDVDYSITSAHNLVNDIMNFNRNKTIDMSPVSFYKTLSGALRQVLSINTNVEIELQYHFDGKTTVLADESSLSGVLTNLISNAVEAIRDIGKSNKGKIVLSTEVKGNEFIFSIFNDGPAIPEHILPEIMKPLFTHGKKQGTGLGLASVSKIIKEHGGNLSVRNVDNKGVEFSFSLKNGSENDHIDLKEFKLNSTDYFYVSSKKNATQIKNPFRIFLLDDDRQVYEYFHHMVQNLSFEVELAFASNVDEAITMIKAKRFDLYILDYDIGSKMTGLDFYHQYLNFLSSEVVIHTNREKAFVSGEKCGYQLKPMSFESLESITADLDKKRMKVLLVEDSELTQMVWEIYHGKHNIEIAKSPEDALALLKTNAHFDMCVIDYYFDNSSMNGSDLAVKIKEFLPQMKIVISSNVNVETSFPAIAKDHFEVRNL